MNTIRSRFTGRSITLFAACALVVACTDSAAVAPDRQPPVPSQATAVKTADENTALATMRRVTARYHDLNAATADGFVFLHGCEVRPGEGPVGIVYVHMGRLLDGAIDPELPDGLIYEPRRNESPRLIGVEFAVPYPLWTSPQAPTFFGTSFQREDEFGVFGLHAWVWRTNPEGMFAESNPNVSCGTE